ncbi:MAG TPA: hypothetical protein VM266_06325 [Solirubrobacteraceae bacterium]|nr:hypothetical protein [Solirubrobacteraceae bacterium]
MDSTRRTSRLSLRRVAMMAALAALVAPAGQAEAAKKKVKKPVVTRVAPATPAIGETLTVYGKYFIRGKGRNSVVFKRDGAPAVFVKADVSTRRQIKVVLPAKLSEHLVVKDGTPVATPFRVRVLAKRFGARFTALSKSPHILPAKPPGSVDAPPAAAPDGDCDGDDVKNSADLDDDNDLLSDEFEKTLKTDACKRDSDGDGVEDGYEYRAAVDLNDDEYQDPNRSLPYPGKRPYPNPLDGTDAETDYDGDSLSQLEEYKLWIYTIQSRGEPRSLASLSYSDGLQHSRFAREADGRRKPSVAALGYDRQQEFLAWAADAGNGYSPVHVSGVNSWWYEPRQAYDIRDFNRDGTVSQERDLNLADDGKVYLRAEVTYYDADQDGWLHDGERDEDADGLNNFEESHGCTSRPEWWEKVYTKETGYPVKYAGTRLDDPDSDGDGVRDGADDQDHDDLTNVWECSRQAASGRPPTHPDADEAPADPKEGFVNPFNPCLPSQKSRTCNRYPNVDKPWAPYNPKDVYYFVFN